MKSGRWWKITALIIGGLLLLAVVVASFLDEPLRGYAERQANDKLPGYQVTIGTLDLHPLTLSVDLRDVAVRQEAHPDPVLMTIPQATLDAQFIPLLSGTIGATLTLDGIHISATRQQVDQALELIKQRPPEEPSAAWQDRLRDAMSVRMAFVLSHGELRYEGPPASAPVTVHDLDVRVENVTNRPGEGEAHPSRLHVAARLLEDAQFELNGTADVLAKPHPAVIADIGLRNFTLEPALVTIGRTDLPVKAGVLEMAGHIEYAPDRKSATIHEIALRRPKVDYVYNPASGGPEAPASTAAGQSRPWQDLVTGVFDVTIERVSIEDGEVFYRHGSSADPIHIRSLGVTAEHIRNRESKPGDLPSDLHVTAQLDRGTMNVDGSADFFAKPLPGIDVQMKVQDLPLKPLKPVAQTYHVQLTQGAFGMSGRVKYSPARTVVAIEDFLLDGAKIDYVHSGVTKEKEKAKLKKGAQKTKESHQDSRMAVTVKHGKILNSEMGFVNESASPQYRVFMGDMNLDMDHFSNRLEEGTGVVKLTGKFMGSGPTVVSGTFRPEKPRPDFDLEVKIIKTKVQSLNNVLRAYGKIDTVEGLFAFFSELSVKNNHIDGYVKPLLKDVEVYDPKQDKDKAVTRRVYEAVVGGVLGALENAPRKEVATQTDVSGPVENPQADTWQVVGNLIQNAFFKAILPGFAKDHLG